MEDLNEVKLVGTITTDLILRDSSKGTKWMSFTIQTICGGFKKINNVMAFGEVAEKIAASAKKDGRIKVLASVGLSKNAKSGQWLTGISVFKYEILPDEETYIKPEAAKVAKPIPAPEKSDVPQGDDLPF